MSKLTLFIYINNIKSEFITMNFAPAICELWCHVESLRLPIRIKSEFPYLLDLACCFFRCWLIMDGSFLVSIETIQIFHTHTFCLVFECCINLIKILSRLKNFSFVPRSHWPVTHLCLIGHSFCCILNHNNLNIRLAEWKMNQIYSFIWPLGG